MNDAVRAVVWGVAARPALRARDLAAAARDRAILRTYLALWRLERDVPPHQPSRGAVDDAARSGLPESALTWGETPFATALDVLEQAGVGPGDRVVDVGAGRGMVLLAARALGASARGIEIDPLRARPAMSVLGSIGAELVVGDARDGLVLDGATHVWLAWTCMPDDVRAHIAGSLRALPSGARVIALTWAPPADAFDVVTERSAAFSWGRATAVIARRR